MRLASLFIFTLLQLSRQELPDGKTLLQREADALQNYASYQYNEEVTMQMTVAGYSVNTPMMKMLVQAAKPNRLRIETKGEGDDSLTVSDGITTWTYTPMRKQYTKHSGSEAALEALATPLTGDARILGNAITRGSETLDVDGTPHECWVVESRVANGSFDGMEIEDAVYVTWTDKETGIALQRSVSAKTKGEPVPGAMMQVKSIKQSLKLDEPLPPSLFTFVPPADAKEEGSAQTAAEPAGATSTRQAASPRQPGEPQAYVPFLSPIYRVDAEWPESAKEKGIQGMVEVLVTVSPEGLVSAAEALSGPEILRKPAIDAVKQWRFQPVLRDHQAVSAYTQTSVEFMDFNKPVTPQSMGLDIGGEMTALLRMREIEDRFPRSPEQVFSDLEQDSTGRNGLDRSLMLPQLAKAAVKAGALDKANQYANELIASIGSGGWNDGNALHDGHMVRGLVALRNGSVQQAARDLIEAGKTSGSPQLNSFGPNMTLANELLEKGERDAVLEYLTLCRNFWKMGSSKLDAWIGIIRAGGRPDFGANLLY